MNRFPIRIAATLTALLLATLPPLPADSPPHLNLLIIGASSLNSPVAQTQLVGAMLEVNGMPMNIKGKFPKLDAVGELLKSKKEWDYIVLDAWHLGRGRNEFGQAGVPAEFGKALAAFVKQARAHSPRCKIILFSWWVPSGPKATNEGVMEVFERCAQEAKANGIWTATTGPAFMEAKLERPDLRIEKSKTDAHPGTHGAYLNACSLYAILTGQTPVGLPATLKLTADGGGRMDYTVAPADAKYLQELAWKVYERESKKTKPGK